MVGWTREQLAEVGAADELRIAPRRQDGTLQRPRIIWVVRHDDDLFVRSVNGPTAAWFLGAQMRHEGHISAGGVDTDAIFEEADHALDEEIDEGYRRKYGRSSTSVNRITSSAARSTTIRLLPARQPTEVS